VPHFTLYGDGTVIFRNPMLEAPQPQGSVFLMNPLRTAKLTEAQTQLTDMSLVGQYAVAPTWADGHHTGFYTFQRLREECPCPEDTARRGSQPHATHRLG